MVFLRQPDRRLLDPAYLERFAGTYTATNDSVQVRVQGTSLVMVFRGQPPRPLVPDRGSEFNLKGLAGYSVEFVEDSRGVVIELRSKQPNGVFVMRKVSP